MNLYLNNLLYKFTQFFFDKQTVTKQNAHKQWTQRALDLNIGISKTQHTSSADHF